MAVRIEGLKELQNKLTALPQTMRSEIGAELKNSANEYAGLAKQDAPGDTGTLRGEITVQELDDLNFEVVSGALYAGFVEFGTRTRVEIPAGLEEVAAEVKAQQGTTSVKAKDAIFEWCRKKGIDQDLWYPIFISIMTKGIHAHPYFFKQKLIIEPKLVARINNILADII
jgi:hypothetical protein